MILVLAASHDQTVFPLCASWGDAEALCLRPADLAQAGWRHFVDVPGAEDTVPVDGGRLGVRSITGVLTRTPWVTAAELPQIASPDRDYVSAELSALLLSWLNALPCRVVNRPMPGSLGGVPWRTMQWRAAARLAGLRVGDTQRPKMTRTNLIVVGNRCFGTMAPELESGSIRLARIAGADLLGIAFDVSGDEAWFAGATCYPRLDDPDIGAALLELLRSPPPRRQAFPDLRPWRSIQAARSAATASAMGCSAASAK